MHFSIFRRNGFGSAYLLLSALFLHNCITPLLSNVTVAGLHNPRGHKKLDRTDVDRSSAVFCGYMTGQGVGLKSLTTDWSGPVF